MAKLKLNDINIWRGHPATWDHAQDQQTTKTTLLGTMSWFLVGATLLFILLSALLIGNGSCSDYRGLSARAPVCVGGHLSVQSWLAIVGVGFTILGIVVLPHKHSPRLEVGRVDTVVLENAKAAINMGCDNTGSCNASLSHSNLPLPVSQTTTAKFLAQARTTSPSNSAKGISIYALQHTTPETKSLQTLLIGSHHFSHHIRTSMAFVSQILPIISFIDIFSSNGTLEVLSGTFGILNQESKYLSMLSASVEVCLGFASWSINNTDTPTSYLQDPTDITCIEQGFNLKSWMQDPSSQFPIG
ncbi:hypothetical protein NA56DRAFT_707881 [Hyaloscypha hepaticicola]|uniref:Uncharacterized protein n=1 Tax=Hyaloscypha hepaticicola TaxID=2082293 RepID=A0A2J6PTL6_9HELO|nr:hypothetical protein NA56DRAFT_707881 [Hyaloscypha hepaticicola]